MRKTLSKTKHHMEDQQKQLVAKLKDAQNVLVTVSKNPSVDQLAAAIGLTLALNKLDKHATAVYSGETPSTIEFLKPEATLETNTDSLRDFIIALDKSKADKLRYKVEDQVVRIFITPYRTSISQDDLEFSQGDFNVDVVVALGVQEQTDLDQAIQAHGRILHDAVVATVSIEGESEIGSLNLVNADASSLSEIVTKIVQGLDKECLDGQIATALLTGIVAMTERFSNDRTTPETMSVSATLMSAGANQQLIAAELAPPSEAQEMTSPSSVPHESSRQDDPGTLEIEHEEPEPDAELPPVQPSEPSKLPEPEHKTPQVEIGENGELITGENEGPQITNVHSQPISAPQVSTENIEVTRERITEPPGLGGELTANVNEEALDAPTEALVKPAVERPILSHNERVLSPQGPTVPYDTPTPRPTVTAVTPLSPIDASAQGASETFVSLPTPLTQQPAVPIKPPASPLDEKSFVPAPVGQPAVVTAPPPVMPMSSVEDQMMGVGQDDSSDDVMDTSKETLSDIEKRVESPHLQPFTPDGVENDVDAARRAVQAALAGGSAPTPEPIVALNAQPLGPELHPAEAATTAASLPPFQPAPGFGDIQPPAQPPTDIQTNEVSNTPPPVTAPGAMPSLSAAPVVVSPTSQDKVLPPPPPVPPPPIFPVS